MPVPGNGRAAALIPPRVLGPTASEVPNAASEDAAGSETGSAAVVSPVLLLVDGLPSELLNDELLSSDRLLSDGPVDPLSSNPAPTSAPVPVATPASDPESTEPSVAPDVSLGSSPMMVPRSGKPPNDSFTEVIEARQRM